jgi:hypothetical protein
MNADQIRRKIRSFLDTGVMGVGEFQAAIQVNSRSWHMFMTQRGPQNGIGSTVFDAAWVYFKGRELEGLKMPKKPKVVKDVDENGEEKEKTTKKAKGKGKGTGEVPDVDDIKLPYEEEDNVSVFDTCDDIRRKINVPGVTQAAFSRELAKQFHTEERKIQGAQISAFRSKKGSLSGNTSAVFYGACCYFEKIRIKEGKPKSEHRLEMEEVHGENGLNTKELQNRAFIMAPGQSWTFDNLGRHIVISASGEAKLMRIWGEL